MGFGIRFETTNGQVQIDSETTGSGFIVTNSGTSSTLGLPAAGEMTFARPNVRTSTTTIAYAALGGTFVNPAGTAVTCDWIRGIWANDSSVTPSSSGYGLQVYNSDGELAFDSNMYNGNGGFGVTDYVASGTITPTADNDPNGGIATSTVISTDLNAYYDMSDTNRTSFPFQGDTFTGYVFRPATGVHWLGYSDAAGFGFPPTTIRSYSTNPTIFYGARP